MAEVSQAIVDIVNKPGRVGVLGTADTQGCPNVAYFGSPRLKKDGTLTMGLAENRTLKNLESNPQAVFFCVEDTPVSFQTKGYRLYLKVKDMQRQGPVLDSIREMIAEKAGPQAAQMISAGITFEVIDVRPLLAMG
jgi:hypothetical protein